MTGGFQGLYFPDLEVTVDIGGEHRQGFRGWRINGRDVPGAAPLTFAADRPTAVEAVFEGSPAGRPAAEPRAAPVHKTGVPRESCGAPFQPANRGWAVSPEIPMCRCGKATRAKRQSPSHLS